MVTRFFKKLDAAERAGDEGAVKKSELYTPNSLARAHMPTPSHGNRRHHNDQDQTHSLR